MTRKAIKMCKFVKKRGKHLVLKTSGILKFNFQKLEASGLWILLWTMGGLGVKKN